MLPDSYVNSTEERLSLYQKLAEIPTKENSKFENELVDRFWEFTKRSH